MMNIDSKYSLDLYCQSYWDYYLAIEERFSHTERYCAFSERNRDAFSIEYLTLYLAACGEIDSLGKEIVRQLFPNVNLNKCTISKWGYYLGEAFPNLGIKTVEFNRKFKFRPFDGWKQVKSENKNGSAYYKRADNSKPLTWWTDYNSVKHNRVVIDENTGVGNYEKASQGNLLRAIGALFLMNRLMMLEIDKDGYSSIRHSSLFRLCGSIDEAKSTLFYSSDGHPCMRVEEPPSE